MKSQATSKGRLSAIDLVFSVMDSPRRPLDFTLLFHLKDHPGLEALRAGAFGVWKERADLGTTDAYVSRQRRGRRIDRLAG